MKMTMFVLVNNLTGIAERPFCEDVSKDDYPERITAALSAANPAELQRHSEFKVMSLGTFDTKYLEIDHKIDFVCDLGPICEQIMLTRSKKNGERNESTIN